MNTEHLKLFIDIVDNGSFSKTQKRNCLSSSRFQPPLIDHIPMFPRILYDPFQAGLLTCVSSLSGFSSSREKE